MLDDASVRDTSLTAGSMGTNASVGKMPEKSFSQRVKGILAKALGADKPIERRAELRMKLPRRPVHSLHVAVSGLAARDLSAHFVQVYTLKFVFYFYMVASHSYFMQIISAGIITACPKQNTIDRCLRM